MASNTSKQINKNLGNTLQTKRKFRWKKIMGGNSNLEGKNFTSLQETQSTNFQKLPKGLQIMLVKSIPNGGDIQYMIENMSDLNLTRPIDPPDRANQYKVESWKKQLDLFWK